MEDMAYFALYEGGSCEITEKKSRFIATLRRIESEEEALVFLGEMKKKYWDASHNCFAYVAGRNHELKRCSDDGEPNGTAGRPMLDVLLKEDVHNAAVVVTRYFGGTLLGTGGLVRAYQRAVQEGLAHSVVIQKRLGQQLWIETDYEGFGKIQYLLAQYKIPVLDTEYTEQVRIRAMAPMERLLKLEKDIMEKTSGNARIGKGSKAEFALIQEELIIFEKK